MSIDVLDDLQNLARDAEGWLPPTIEYVSERAIAEIGRLKAELEEAREIMKPFSALANKFSDTGHSDDWHIGGRHKTEVQHADIRLGHLRRARAFLDKAGK